MRVYGTVTPAENGMQIGVMKLVKGSEKLSGGAVLKADGASASRFSTTIKREKSLYRVLVVVSNGSQANTYSSAFLIR